MNMRKGFAVCCLSACRHFTDVSSGDDVFKELSPLLLLDLAKPPPREKPTISLPIILLSGPIYAN